MNDFYIDAISDVIVYTSNHSSTIGLWDEIITGYTYLKPWIDLDEEYICEYRCDTCAILLADPR